MKRLATSVTAFLVLAFAAFAGGDFIMASVDPAKDSAAVARMRVRMDAVRTRRPAVGLVLSGGGAKGAAHVGVLKYLEEQGLPVDMIIGTSMGGLMGGLYAVGYSADEIISILTEADWDLIMSDRVSNKYTTYEKRKYNESYQLRIPLGRDRKIRLPGQDNDRKTSMFPDGYLSGFNVVNMLSSLTVGYQDSMDFADLPIPFFCVSTDLSTLKQNNHTSGCLPEAMRSTMSIPLFFTPVRKDGKVLIDGGTRDNFPIDIARAMGADIVIGIDLNTTVDNDPVKGVVDVISQSINLMGQQAYDINKYGADLYVHPDMEGMGMMSFDKESIETLIRRGYDAMTEKQSVIDSIKALTGAPGIILHNKPAVDISKSPVLIQSLSYYGLESAEGQYFFDKSKLVPGRAYTKEEIEKELAHIYGTGAFKNVRYGIHGRKDPYSLEFSCEKGFVHNMGVNLRADNEEYLALFLNFGINANKLCGFKYTFDVKLSANPYIYADICYTPIHGSEIGLTVGTRYMDCDVMDPHSEDSHMRLQEWFNNMNLYIGSSKFSDGVIRGGLDLESTPFEVSTNAGVSNREVDWKKLNIGAYAELRFDNLDNGYFPTRGLGAGLKYKYVFYGQAMKEDGLNNYSPYHLASFDLSGVIPVVRRFDVIPSIMARFAVGSEIPQLRRNRIGGIIPGRYSGTELPYIGYSGVYQCDNLALVGNVDFRFTITSKDFVSAVAAVYNEAPDFSHLKMDPTSYAFGVKYGRNTIIGPVRAHFAWSNNTGINLYVSAGFDF